MNMDWWLGCGFDHICEEKLAKAYFGNEELSFIRPLYTSLMAIINDIQLYY